VLLEDKVNLNNAISAINISRLKCVNTD